MLGLLDDFFCKLEGTGTAKTVPLLQSVNTVFNKKLSEFEKNGFRLTDRSDYFSCGYPTQNLLKCGLKGSQEIVLTQSVVRKAIGLARGKSDEAHALQVSDLKDLPSKLHHPVLVITGNLSGSRLIFVEISQTGRKVMAVIHLEKHTEKGVVAAIATIYSKPSQVVGLLIEQACARNEVWYYDEKKLGDWLSVTGQLQLLPRIKANPLYGAANIAQKSAQVKFNQKNILKRIYRADDCTDTRDCIINLYECFEAIKLLDLNGQPHGMINTRVFQLTKRYAVLAEREGVAPDWQTALNRYRNESLGTLDVETIEEVSHIVERQARQNDAESSSQNVPEDNQKAKEPESNSDEKVYTDDLNEQFNRELALLKQGKLSQNHIFQLGMPSECLIQSGIDRLPIELRAKTLKEKSKADYKASHPFDYDDIRDLPNALKHPIAVFQSLRHTNSKVVLTGLYSRSRNFVVAIEVARPIEREGSTILINDIRSLYPKDYVKDILNWICTYNLMPWVDKEKALNWISKLRRSAEVAKLIKGSTNIIQNFQNPKPDELGSENLFGLTTFGKTQKGKTFKLSGNIGKFLGEYDRNRYSIVIRGDKGAGKSRLLYQLINAFASKGLRVAFLSLEMGINSSITQKYKAEYINRKNLNRIRVTDNPLTLDQLQSLCNVYDVLAIDSWTKLRGVSQTDFDALLRNNPQTIVLSIFQSTTDKVTRGGNMPEYDSAVVIHVHRGGVAECEKNRFAPTTIRYNVFTKQIIDEPMEVDHE